MKNYHTQKRYGVNITKLGSLAFLQSLESLIVVMGNHLYG